MESRVLQVGVKIFLKNREGKFLLLKRSPVRYPSIKNSWDIPGGRNEVGKNLFENLQREIREETNLEISGTPKFIFAQDIIRSDKHIVRLTFLGEALGKIILHSDHTEYTWLTLEEMLKLKELDEFTRAVIEKKLVQ